MGFGKDGKGVMIREFKSQALGTLASNTGIFIGTVIALTDDFRDLKIEGTAHIEGLTAGEGTGLQLYLVDGQHTLAEAEAAIEATGPLGSNQSLEAEIAQRFVKLVAVVDAAKADTKVRLFGEAGGPMWTTNPRWTFSNTDRWKWMLYNMSGALQTGATFDMMVTHYGVFIR